MTTVLRGIARSVGSFILEIAFVGVLFGVSFLLTNDTGTTAALAFLAYFGISEWWDSWKERERLRRRITELETHLEYRDGYTVDWDQI